MYNIIHEEDQTEWTKEEILDQVNAINKLFVSPKLNKIASFIPDILNQIRLTNPSNFRTDLTGQNIPYFQATDYNTLINQNMD